MGNGLLRGLSAAMVLLLVVCGEASGQFTQGPPGNPSAAGISTGSPPPVPVPPAVPSPPRSSGILPFVSSPQCTPDAGAIDSPRGMVAAEGMPPVLDTYRDGPLARYLDLSPEQLERLQALRNTFYRDTRDLRYDLSRKRLDMRRLFADPHAAEATLLSRHQELVSLRTKLADMVARAAVEARRLLKPDQIEMLDHLPMQE
jgi:hypothetical protein